MSPALTRYQDGFEHRGAVAREKAAGHRIAASEGGRGRAHRMKRGMSSLVPDSGLQHISMRPSTTGTLSRLACTRAVSAGIDVEPLMLKAGVTRKQVEDQSLRLAAKGQIKFVELVADALHDDFLGFHLARDADFREIGLLYYV
jgi:hypothetical protein